MAMRLAKQRISFRIICVCQHAVGNQSSFLHLCGCITCCAPGAVHSLLLVDAGGSSSEQLAAELSAGRVTAHWSPAEDLEDLLLKVKPEEIKVGRHIVVCCCC
jgi:hypothetical protein